MTPCPHCGAAEFAVCANGDVTSRLDHDCHCIRVDGLRIAMGICCGHSVGDSNAREEDYHAGAPWSVEEDCTCQRKRRKRKRAGRTV
jgi:hypothetical protein